MKKTLDISRVLGTAKAILRKEWKVLIPVVFFSWLFSLVAGFGIDAQGVFGLAVGPDFLIPVYKTFGSLAYVFITLLVAIGLIHIFVTVVDGKEFKRGDLLEGFNFKKLLSFIGAYILYTLAVLVGLLLFIVPGVYIAIALVPIFYVIVEKDMGPIASIKEAYGLTKGSWWSVLAVLILAGIITSLIAVIIVALFALLVWGVILSGSVLLTIVVTVLGVPLFIVLMLFIQTYLGLVYAQMYKQLRDNKEEK